MELQYPKSRTCQTPRWGPSRYNTSAIAPCIWVSAPESGRRGGEGDQGLRISTIYPMEQWQLGVLGPVQAGVLEQVPVFNKSTSSPHAFSDSLIGRMAQAIWRPSSFDILILNW